MTTFERKNIQESLTKVLGRMEPATVEVVAQYTDPLMLVVITMGWLLRVVRVMQERQAEEDARQEAAPFKAADKDKPSGPPRPAAPKKPGDPGYVPNDAELAKALGGS
jgi:hypothetical protein